MLKFIEKYIVKTNFWVAVCFTALVAFFQIQLVELNFYLLGVVFFGTISIYNFTRINTIQELIPTNKNFKLKGKLTYLGTIAAFLFLLLHGFEWKTFIYLFILSILSFLYQLPFKQIGLRYIPFLKLFIIALVWTGSSIGLILIIHENPWQFYYLLFSVFFFIVGITIPFDIRDMQKDQPSLKTIPQLVGLINAKCIAILALLISGICFYLEFKTLNNFFSIWILTLLISSLFILNSTKNRKEFYYSFWMESCSLLPLIFTVLMELILE